MFKRSIEIVTAFLLIVFIGCATGVPKLGTGGKSSVQKIKTGHPDVPEGVNCYVCHKNDIPEEEFHKKYTVSCEDCHGKNTWMAYNYPHETWSLGIHRKMQCNRCHSKMDVYDFSVWQCWGCHHDKKEITESHKKQKVDDINNCIGCHKGTESEYLYLLNIP